MATPLNLEVVTRRSLRTAPNAPSPQADATRNSTMPTEATPDALKIPPRIEKAIHKALDILQSEIDRQGSPEPHQSPEAKQPAPAI